MNERGKKKGVKREVETENKRKKGKVEKRGKNREIISRERGKIIQRERKKKEKEAELKRKKGK